MPDDPRDRSLASQQRHWQEQIAEKQTRKLRARQRTYSLFWFGLGTFGVIGWSIAIPTVGLTIAGVWIDAKVPSRYSWTLMLLFAGILVGCLNAWRWMQSEAQERDDEAGGKR